MFLLLLTFAPITKLNFTTCCPPAGGLTVCSYEKLQEKMFATADEVDDQGEMKYEGCRDSGRPSHSLQIVDGKLGSLGKKMYFCRPEDMRAMPLSPGYV